MAASYSLVKKLFFLIEYMSKAIPFGVAAFAFSQSKRLSLVACDVYCSLSGIKRRWAPKVAGLEVIGFDGASPGLMGKS